MKFPFLIKCALILNCFSALGQANFWAAFSGPSTMANVTPVHGVLGISLPSNTPGTRQGAVTWTDNSGNLWLYGGIVNATYGTGSDLWKYNTISHTWTWINGSNTGNTPAVYGTQGVPAPSNNPGYRLRAKGWVDNAGDLWLYGGFSSTSSDDLWKYSVSTNQWTWMKGSNIGNVAANFGIKGVTSISNTPGTRSDFVSGTDSAGNFWLFSGYGITSINSGPMADLWKYDISMNSWTWMNGTSGVSANGGYVQIGVASPNNYPGARYAASGSVDGAGNFWVFGGNGYPQSNYGILNDLWKYNFSSGLWTWVAGSSTAGNSGSYGVKGTPSITNNPPKRLFASMNSDNLGNLWLFGGNDGTLLNSVSTASHSGNYNDLWRFHPLTSKWTWMAGNSTWDQQGVFGTIGVGSAGNSPGARNLHQMWKDNSGGIWVFGGNGGISTMPSSGWYSDLWEYGTCNPFTSTVNPTPQLTLACSSIICLGETTTLTVTGSPSYSLSNSSSSNLTVLSSPYATITPTQNTTYTVTAMNAYNCKADAVITVSVSGCQSIEPINTIGFRVYPNPFNKNILIASPENENTKVTIFNVDGKMVFSGEVNSANSELRLDNLDRGLYFLYLTTYRGTAPIKIIKE